MLTEVYQCVCLCMFYFYFYCILLSAAFCHNKWWRRWWLHESC